jgi:hypothetical protein
MNAATTIPHTATQTKVVQARNVSKVFKRDAFEVKALDDVSIEIGGGEFLALMGPSTGRRRASCWCWARTFSGSATPNRRTGGTSISATCFRHSI